jgi:uncharacterized protein (UPF0216 family)
MLPFSHSGLTFPEGGIIFRYLSGSDEYFLHQLALLTWIGELKLAQKLWEEVKARGGYFWQREFEDYLFSAIICEKQIGSGFDHPEFGFVGYNILDETESFKLSTAPLSELLVMGKPCFSSVDGLITIDFDRRELERIAKIVPESYQKELRLPLILLKKLKEYDSYKVVGTKLENMLLQKLLKLTGAPFDKYADVAQKTEVSGISMMGRRKFKTIYKVLPESSSIWLYTANERPPEK